MHNGDEYVAAAIRSGGHGYVMKTRIHSDLISAVDHALAGRLFVPSLTSLLTIAHESGGEHAVQFRADDRDGLGELSGLLGAALGRGDSVALVGTSATRARIAERLNANRYNVAEAAGRGQHQPGRR
jgi:DNA-binding NarL/FixJ family response regulator